MAVQSRDGRVRVPLDRLDGGVERVRDELLGALGELLAREVADVVAGREQAALPGQDEAAGVERRDDLGDAVQDRVVERVALALVGDRQARDVRRREVEPELALGELRRVAHSSTTRASPSETDCPSSTRISRTVPSSSASTGISIFIDSRMITVSPSSTWSPGETSIFQTVPVMCASICAMPRDLTLRRRRARRPDR